MIARSTSTAYYANKVQLLKRIFGPDVWVGEDAIVVDGRRFPVHDDVIVTLPVQRWPSSLASGAENEEYAPEVQSTFGDQWQRFPEVTLEHRTEFEQYFDLIDLETLNESLVADLGCGSGRYAACAAPHVGSLVLVDFSEAIFVARRNLARHSHTIFIMGDVLDLPFRRDAFDLAYSLGVLHHLPVPALDALRRLLPLTGQFLGYLYYALDNRPWYYRRLLSVADFLRTHLCDLRSASARAAAIWVITLGAYWPLARLGSLLPKRRRAALPLAEFYSGKSLRRLRQDAHDRFLTPIEQRISRGEIEELASEGLDVRISDGLPYWHFVCARRER